MSRKKKPVHMDRPALCPACGAGERRSGRACRACGAPLALHDRYLLTRFLGSGGQGRTFAAWDLHAEQEVAVKELSLARARDWKTVDLFQRSAAVLAGLHHPGIPGFHEAFEVERAGVTFYYLVTDYVDGESLADEIRRGLRLDEAGAIALAREVLEILDYLHGQSPPVIHRDLKPSNLMRRRDGRLVLIDFDLVRDVLRPEGGSTEGAGTAGYAPLEQYAGRATPATDLYALGATLVALLSGKEPADLFDASTQRLDFRGHLAAGEGLAVVLEKLLEPEPARRYGTARDVLAALDDLTASAGADESAPRHDDGSAARKARPQWLTDRHNPFWGEWSERWRWLSSIAWVIVYLAGAPLLGSLVARVVSEEDVLGSIVAAVGPLLGISIGLFSTSYFFFPAWSWGWVIVSASLTLAAFGVTLGHELGVPPPGAEAERVRREQARQEERRARQRKTLRAKAVQLAWKARAMEAAGLSAAVGAACTVQAWITWKGVVDLEIRCGPERLFERDPSAPVPGCVLEESTLGRGSFACHLRCDASGSMVGEEVTLRLDTARGEAVLTSSTGYGSARLAIEGKAQHLGRPLRRGTVEHQRAGRLLEVSPSRARVPAGTACTIQVDPSLEAAPRGACGVRAICGRVRLFGVQLRDDDQCEAILGHLAMVPARTATWGTKRKKHRLRMSYYQGRLNLEELWRPRWRASIALDPLPAGETLPGRAKPK